MEFDEWMIAQSKWKPSTVHGYYNTIKGSLSQWARDQGYLKSSLLDVISLQEFEEIRIKIQNIDIFLLRNQNGNNIYSNALERYFEYLNYLNEEFSSNMFPDEVSKEDALLEGKSKKVSVNIYERNPKARQKCIETYKCICSVCEFDFEKTYGEIGENFIHVHHLIEISSVDEEYEVDPIKDLRPVCPNCHAMIHKKKPAYTIDEVKAFLKN